MKRRTKTMEFQFQRRIPASPGEVYSAWLNPKVPGTPWEMADKLLLDPKVDGFFYWLAGETAHYGRFTKMKRAAEIQHTWMSPYTLGQETIVTVTFKKAGRDTLMTLVHTGLPNTEEGASHEKGWNYFLDLFPKQFGVTSRD